MPSTLSPSVEPCRWPHSPAASDAITAVEIPTATGGAFDGLVVAAYELAELRAAILRQHLSKRLLESVEILARQRLEVVLDAEDSSTVGNPDR